MLTTLAGEWAQCVPRPFALHDEADPEPPDTPLTPPLRVNRLGANHAG